LSGGHDCVGCYLTFATAEGNMPKFHIPVQFPLHTVRWTHDWTLSTLSVVYCHQKRLELSYSSQRTFRFWPSQSKTVFNAPYHEHIASSYKWRFVKMKNMMVAEKRNKFCEKIGCSFFKGPCKRFISSCWNQ
jgi:hypothetical protein